MTVTCDFQPVAIGGSANVDSQATFLASSYLPNGVTTGTASSSGANKIWRQATFVSSSLAQFICNTLNQNVSDNGNQSAFLTQMGSCIPTLPGPNTWAGAQTFNGAVTLAGAVMANTALTISTGTSTGNTDYLILRPTDLGPGKPEIYFHKDATDPLLWRLQSYDTATAGTAKLSLDLANVTFSGTTTHTGLATFNAGLNVGSGPSTFSGQATFSNTSGPIVSAGAAASNVAYLILRPTDFAAGKPELFIQANSAAGAWLFGTYDGTTFGGGSLSINVATTFTNGLTVQGTLSLPANSVTNAFLAKANTNTLKGNNTASSATPADLTVAQVQTMLGLGPMATSAGLVLHVVEITTVGAFSISIPSTALATGYGIATGGGGGAGGSTSGRCGGGGGAGGTAEGPLTLTPGGTITGTLGAGGAGGVSGADGQSGSSTTLGTLNGGGGQGGAVVVAVAGGTGGGASGGTLNVPGGCGVDGLTTSNIGPWASGGASRWGGGLRAGNGGAIATGAAPGAGGGAAYAAAASGGTGLNGVAVLYYWTT